MVDVVDGMFDGAGVGLLGFCDLALRHELGWIGAGAVGLGVQPQVGHGPVEDRCHHQQLGLLHHRYIFADYRSDLLVAVVHVRQLGGVGPETTFIEL